MLRIQDVYPGSDFFPYRIQIFSNSDPGSASKNLSILTQKYDQGCSSRIRILIFYPSRIPDPGVKTAPDPGSATLESRKRFQLPFSFWPKPDIADVRGKSGATSNERTTSNELLFFSRRKLYSCMEQYTVGRLKK